MKVLKEELLIERAGVFYMPDVQEESSVYESDEFRWMNAIQDKSWWMHHRVSVITALVENYAQSGTFVEIGAGVGSISNSVSKSKKLEVIAFEPGISGAKFCASQGRYKVVCGYFGQNLVNENTVDNVGCFDVLEHIENDRAFLREIYYGLKKGGTLFLTVPAYSWLYSYSDKEGGHYRRYDMAALLTLLAEEGLEVRYKGYFLSLLPPVMYLFRKVLSKRDRKFKQGAGEFVKSKESNLTALTNQFYLPPILNKLVELIFAPEVALIKRRKSIPFGASIIVAAVKV